MRYSDPHIRTCAFGNSLSSEEGDIVDIDICVIIRYSIDRAVRITGVINEPCWSSDMHTVTHVTLSTLLLSPFIEIHQVDLLVNRAAFVSIISFVVSNDLSPVSVDKLAPLQVNHASQAPSAVVGLEDLQRDRPAVLYDPIFTVDLAITQAIALIDMVPILEIERSETAIIELTSGIGEDFFAVGI